VVDVSAWSGLVLGAEIAEGNRNSVWRASIGDTRVAVRRSRRSGPSLAWELDLIDFLDGQGFVVPVAIRADNGRRSVNDVVVQRWIDGRQPDSDGDWQQIADELQRLHVVTSEYEQRPGCCSVVELDSMRRSVDADIDRMDSSAAAQVLAVFSQWVGAPTAVVHGDVGAPNLRVTADGAIGFLDWDESRVDITAHDLSPLGVQVLDDAEHTAATRLSHAWEAANGWTAEPDYARRRLAELN